MALNRSRYARSPRRSHDRIAADSRGRAGELPGDGRLRDDRQRLHGGDVAALDQCLACFPRSRGRRNRAAASAWAAASWPLGRRSPRRSSTPPRCRRRGSSGAGSRGSISSCAAEPRRRASSKPSPTSTPFTAWMDMSAAAVRASSRSSRRCRTSPAPAETPRARTSTTPPSVSRSSRAASIAAPHRLVTARPADLDHAAPATSAADLAEERLRHRARRHEHGRVARARPLERVPDVVVPVLERAREIGVAGPGQRHALRSLACGPALRRSWAHPPLPVLVVAVADDERERRAERPPVPEAGEHLDLVLLELLARAAAVALLAPVEVGVDRRPVDGAGGGEPGDDEQPPVRQRPVRLLRDDLRRQRRDRRTRAPTRSTRT